MATHSPDLLPNLVHHNPFHSFWMAGYECTDKLNAFGHRVDFLHETGHLQLINQDYQNLAPYHIKTVREGIRWSQVEQKPYTYDWSTVALMLESSKAHGIQISWDICHFGFADDLTPLHPLFAQRFAALCKAFILFYRSHYPDDTLIVTPINEVSFLSWLGGDVRGTAPYCTRQGWEVKYGLMRAYIEGVAAMREVDPTVRILTTEPLIQVVAPLHATEEDIGEANRVHATQYEAVDILSGRLCPELGGLPEYLDILGFNFYHNNRWVIGFEEKLSWMNLPPDPRWRTLASLLAEAYERYQRPMVLTETSHPGIHRPEWISYIAQESVSALQAQLPLWGVCLYPIIDRPDWDHLHHWHQSGLWDAEIIPGQIPQRVLYEPYAQALQAAQMQVEAATRAMV
ncbi:amine oxidase [Pontibacter toksunensis]|uniref:Amine oxidase n=1 Tax=Pontibacter toksunensis TaxID=1332631 RepID=A0ABW6BQT9_9BACT